jgi:hypothetical protein
MFGGLNDQFITRKSPALVLIVGQRQANGLQKKKNEQGFFPFD